MAWYNEENPEILNFVLVGNCGSGHHFLRSSLNAHPAMVCHADLLSSDESTRKQEHEHYFGASGKFPDWYQPHILSMEQYLNNKIFDNNLHNEKAIGVCIDYQTLYDGDLWEYLDQKCRQGDFCLIHVVRNPVACFVAQNAKSNAANSIKFGDSVNCTVNKEKLIKFVRNHIAAEMKVNQVFTDKVVLDYHELLLDFKGTIENVFSFLGIPFSSACIPNRKNKKVREVANTITNYSMLESELPLDVADFLKPYLLV